MVVLKWTKTLWVDMWNIWHGEFVAGMMWAFTGNIYIGVASGLILLVINMKLADYHAKKYRSLTVWRNFCSCDLRYLYSILGTGMYVGNQQDTGASRYQGILRTD